MPKLHGYSSRHGAKTNHGRKLLVQSTVVGHILKGIWVPERVSLAGSFVYSSNQKMYL